MENMNVFTSNGAIPTQLIDLPGIQTEEDMVDVDAMIPKLGKGKKPAEKKVAKKNAPKVTSKTTSASTTKKVKKDLEMPKMTSTNSKGVSSSLIKNLGKRKKGELKMSSLPEEVQKETVTVEEPAPEVKEEIQEPVETVGAPSEVQSMDLSEEVVEEPKQEVVEEPKVDEALDSGESNVEAIKMDLHNDTGETVSSVTPEPVKQEEPKASGSSTLFVLSNAETVVGWEFTKPWDKPNWLRKVLGNSARYPGQVLGCEDRKELKCYRVLCRPDGFFMIIAKNNLVCCVQLNKWDKLVDATKRLSVSGTNISFDGNIAVTEWFATANTIDV